MLRNKWLYAALFTAQLSLGASAAQNDQTTISWAFDKVAKENLFGEGSLFTRSTLEENFKPIVIVQTSKTLSVRNGTEPVCSASYAEVVKTPLQYLSNQGAVERYRELLAGEDETLADSLGIVTVQGKDKPCPAPYGVMVKNGDKLIAVNDDGWPIFFKASTGDSLSDDDESPEFCQDLNEGKVFDGSQAYRCFYPNHRLVDAYARRLDGYYEMYFLPSLTPGKNANYEKNGGRVNYRWENGKTLRIVVALGDGSEVTTYLFSEETAGTRLNIDVETGY